MEITTELNNSYYPTIINLDNSMPKHWQLKKLGEVFVIERGGSPRPIEDYITKSDDGINWIKIGDTKGVTKYITKTQEKIKPEGLKKTRMVYKGDFILSNSMSFGRPYIMKTSGCIHDGWLVIRRNENIDNDFLFYVLNSNSVYAQFSNLAKGSTVKNLNIAAVQQVEIPIPPLSEQQAIVAKIEELLSELENGKQQLLTAQQQLKVYRQSLLKWAFEGKLTNKNIKDGELPKGWKWVLINDIGKIKGGKRLPPKHQYSEEPTDYAYIMAGNLKDGTVKNKTTFIKEETYNALSNYKVIGGEVYITIVGACIGDAGVIPESIGKSILTENAAKIIELKGVLNNYLSRWINSHNCQLQIKRKILSATLGKLALNRIGTIEVPLPSLEEQQLIVSELESKLTVCAKIEETISQSLQQAETLRQSILKKAFEGKLI